MEMYWADTEEGFQAFYACLLAIARKEHKRRYPVDNDGVFGFPAGTVRKSVSVRSADCGADADRKDFQNRSDQ